MKFLDYLKEKTNRKNNTVTKLTLSDITSLSPESEYNAMDKVRLVYANLQRVPVGYKFKQAINTEMFVSNPYLLPDNMSKEDAYKVISYLCELTAQTHDMKDDSKESIMDTANELLSNYGFSEIRTIYSGNYRYLIPDNRKPFVDQYVEVENVTDLFTVGGDPKLFDKSNMGDNYFDWFTPGLTKEDIDNIYAKSKSESENQK